MFDPTLGPNAPQKLALQTRKGGVVDNVMNPTDMYDGVGLKVAALRAKYHKATHRTVGPSARYNCHGLTFAARRTGIHNPAQVQRIIDDDGYRKLELSEPPCPGDIAVYLEDGDMIHSGIVVEVKNNEPWILGKWGDCHEVIHPVRYCEYDKAAVSYYRLMK